MTDTTTTTEEERRAWDMYAAQVLGTGSSNGLPLAAIDAAEYADVLLAERRKRFSQDDARGVHPIKGCEAAYARGKADGTREERERIARMAMDLAKERSACGSIYAPGVAALESFAADLRSPTDKEAEK